MGFKDRIEAGQLLAQKLSHSGEEPNIVVGLARGGLIVAHQIARALSIPFDVLVVKKIGAPHNSEFALGALAPDGVREIRWRTAASVGADEHYIATRLAALSKEIKEKTRLYRRGRKPLVVKDNAVILTDDGIATGASFEAAIKWCNVKQAKSITAAVPVMPFDAVARIRPKVDQLVTLMTPQNFGAVGQYYEQFDEIEDTRIVDLLTEGGKA